MSVVCEVCFFYSVFLDWTAEFTLNHCATGSSFVVMEGALKKRWLGACLCCASVFMPAPVCLCASIHVHTRAWQDAAGFSRPALCHRNSPK